MQDAEDNLHRVWVPLSTPPRYPVLINARVTETLARKPTRLSGGMQRVIESALSNGYDARFCGGQGARVRAGHAQRCAGGIDHGLRPAPGDRSVGAYLR